MKKALYLADLITNAYPERMRLLYQDNGITAPVSAKSFMDAYLVLGEPFLMDVFNIIWAGMKQSRFSNVTGDLLSYTLDTKTLAPMSTSTPTTLDENKTKTSFWDGLSNTFNTAGGILGSVVGAYDSVSGIFGSSKVGTTTDSAQAQAELQAAMYKAQLEQQQAEQDSQTKTWLLVGAGVVVVALVIVMIIKKK